MKNTKKKGFTIVELVIVIAVIGILSAILIPTFSNLVANSKAAALQANLRNAYAEYTAEEAEEDVYYSQANVYFVEKNGTAKTKSYVYQLTGNDVGKYVETDTPANTLAAKEGFTPTLTKLGTFNNYDAYAWTYVANNPNP